MKNTATLNQFSQEKINWIRLARTENIGPATFFRLLKAFKTASEAVDKASDFAMQAGRSKPINIKRLDEINTEIDQASKYGAQILILNDEDYPNLLREIYDPAPVLTIMGNADLFRRDIIAIVGPRNATFHACKFAEKMAYDLGLEGVCISSGLAKGLDASAHKGSLKTGTIAIIAGGINSIYPAENADLYHQIANEGLIVSEQSFGSPPKSANFIQRNRIISGISYGVVVVEAGMQSGSLATARFAADQGREVFAIPGFPNDPRNYGSNMLLEDGAIFTQGASRIMREMPSMRMRFSQVKKFEESQIIDFEMPEQKMPSDDDIKKAREEISNHIGFIAISIDEIIAMSNIPIRVANIALVQLELADKIAINYGMVVKK